MARKLNRLPVIILAILIVGTGFSLRAQTVPFPPNPDPTEFAPWGYQQVGTNWDTSPYLPFKYDGKAMRVMPPNGVTYNASNNTWNFDPAVKYPIICFFHGRGESGLDNNDQLKHGGQRHRNAVLSDEFPGFLLYPQDATPAHMKSILDKMIEIGIPIDQSRIYAHGLSRGGKWTWDFALSYPSTVAAFWPMSGIVDAQDYTELIYTPIRLTQGGRDSNPNPNAAESKAELIDDIGGDIEYILLPDAGHGTWNQMYNRSDFFSWFLSHSINKVYAFDQYFEVCPEDPVLVTLGVTPGHDNYEWRKWDANLGDYEVLAGENSHELIVTEFGDYSARVQINGEWTDWSAEDMTVGEKQPTQTPPISLAGMESYVLPDPNGTTTVDLTLPDGYEQYEWFESGSSVSTSQVLSAGVGVYTALVQEEFGCSSELSAPFTVIQNTGVGVPNDATNVQVQTVSKTELDVTWTDNANDEIGLELWRRASLSDPYEMIALLAPDTESFSDQGLVPGTEYFYSLRAINSNGASNLSAEGSGTTDTDVVPPTVPMNLDIQYTTSVSATLDWEESTDDVGLARYDIYQNGVKVLSTTETFITVYNLVGGLIYRFNVVAVDDFGNESPWSNRVIVSPVSSGLNYKYYENSGPTWSVLPDFNGLTPVAQGVSDNVDLSYRQRNEDFGFIWEGKLTIPEPGVTMFETISDDGSKLYIGGYNEDHLVVNNDGLHGARSAYGNNTATNEYPSGFPAGVYDIAMTFFERGGGERMEAYWYLGGVRQAIPSSAFSDEMIIPTEIVDSPSGFTATTLSTEEIQLDWVDESDNEINFQLFRATETDLTYRPVALMPSGTTTYNDTGLEPDTKYFYQIVALGQYGQSGAAYTLNPVLYMPLDNSLLDLSNNAIQSSTAGIIEYDETNKVLGTHSISFINNGSYVTLDNGDEFIHSQFTERSMALWLYSSDNSGLQDVFDEGGSTNGCGLRINNGSIEFGVQDSHNRASISAAIPTDTWVHIAAVFDNGRIELFIDGVLAASNSNVGYQDVGGHSNAGALGGTNGSNAFDQANNNFSGLIDDFYVFEDALTTTDISALISSASDETETSATTWPLPQPGDALENFTATVLSQLSVELSWDAQPVAAYQVLRSPNTNDNFSLLAYLNVSMNSYVDETIEPHTDYYYVGRTISTNGYSPNSDTVLVSIPNAIPVMETTVPDYDLYFEDIVSLPIEITDEDGDIVSFQTQNFPAFASLVDNGDNTALLTIDPEATDFGSYPNLDIEVNDGFGGVINATFNLSVVSNIAPVIDPVQNETISGGDVLNVVVNATDPNGDNLTWTVGNLPSFGTATPSGGQLTLDFAPDLMNDGGVYILDLRVDDDNAVTPDYDEVQLTLTVIPYDPNFEAYVNFGVSSTGVSTASSPWNNFQLGFPSAGRNIADLVNDDGFTTAISVHLETAWSGKSTSGGMKTGVYEENVMKSNIYSNEDLETVRVSGLDVNSTYNFDFMASRNATGDRRTEFEIGGQTAMIDASKNTSNLAEIDGVAPDVNGDIFINVNRPAGSVTTYLNAMVIEAVSSSGIPPLQPSDLTAVINVQVQLDWTDNSVNEDGFHIFRSDAVDGTYVNVGSVGVDQTSYNDVVPLVDQTYYYRVDAYNAFGSASSGIANVFVPDLPPSFIGTPGTDLTAEAQVITNFEFEATDAPADVLTFSISNNPSFLSLVDNGDRTATLVCDPVTEDRGVYSDIVLNVSDGTLDTDFTFNLEVLPSGFEEFQVNITGGTVTSDPDWNNFVTNGDAGTSITNLTSTEGDVSGISIELLDEWNGSNVAGMTGAVFPDEVSTTAIWENSTSINQLLVQGLDINKIYKFGFFSSRSGGGERITEFTIGGKTVELQAASNTHNIAYITNIVPDINGDVVISAQKQTGSQYAYINAVTIEGVLNLPGAIDYDPIALGARGLNSGDIQLDWVETIDGEDEFEIWRSTDPDDASFSLLATVPANTTTYLDNGVTANQLYYYKVRARIDTYYADFSNTSSTSTLIFAVYLNFNEENPQTVGGWNNMNSAILEEQEIIASNLDNTLGQSTGINVRLPWENPTYPFPTYGFNGVNINGVNTGSDSGVVPDNVMRSTYWMDPGKSAEVIFEAMNLSFKYSFEFFASRNGGGNRTTNYTIDGTTVSLNAAYNTSETVVINDVVPDESAQVNVLVQTAQGASFGYLGGIKIYAYMADVPQGAKVADFGSAESTIAEVLGEDEIYPNPFNDEFTIVPFLSEGVQVELIRILDLQGRVVNSILPDAGSLDKIVVDSRGMNEGMYVVEIFKSDNSRKIFRLIKAR